MVKIQRMVKLGTIFHRVNPIRPDFLVKQSPPNHSVVEASAPLSAVIMAIRDSPHSWGDPETVYVNVRHIPRLSLFQQKKQQENHRIFP